VGCDKTEVQLFFGEFIETNQAVEEASYKHFTVLYSYWRRSYLETAKRGRISLILKMLGFPYLFVS
jgi:hypothetical protein